MKPPVDLDATLPITGQRTRLQPAVEVLPMRCLRCQGPVERGTAPVHLEGEGYRLAWDEVPAWICTRCESAYFEPEQVAMIQRAVRSMRSRKPAGH